MLLKIAWLNIWRNKKRSVIIIAAVIIGVSTGIFLMAFYNGMIEQRVRMAIQYETSHVQLHHPLFRQDYDLKYYLDKGPAILQQLQEMKYVKQASGRLIIPAMIASASGSSGIMINAVIPQKENLLTGLAGKVKEGNYFNPAVKNELLVGEKQLKKLKFRLNGKAILTFQDTAGNIVSMAFRITGIFKTANTPYDEGNVFVDIKDLDSVAGLPDQFNQIAVLLHAGNQLGEAEREFKYRFTDMEIKNWKEISPEIGLMVSVAEQMVLIFMVIILLALAFGIINTMLMAILERTREIGMLLALGMNRLKIFTMVLMETLLLVLAGCPAGIGIALAAIGITRQSGISFKKFSEVYASFGYSDVIFPELTFRQFCLSMLLVVITAILASLFPAWRAVRLNPAKAMRK